MCLRVSLPLRDRQRVARTTRKERGARSRCRLFVACSSPLRVLLPSRFGSSSAEILDAEILARAAGVCAVCFFEQYGGEGHKPPFRGSPAPLFPVVRLLFVAALCPFWVTSSARIAASACPVARGSPVFVPCSKSARENLWNDGGKVEGFRPRVYAPLFSSVRLLFAVRLLCGFAPRLRPAFPLFVLCSMRFFSLFPCALIFVCAALQGLLVVSGKE